MRLSEQVGGAPISFAISAQPRAVSPAGIVDAPVARFDLDELVNKACEQETASAGRSFDEAMRLLRKALVDSPDDLNKKGAFEVTVLHTACGWAAPETLKTLLTHNAEVTNPDILLTNCFGQTPLRRLYAYAKRKDGAKRCAAMILEHLAANGLEDKSAPSDLEMYGSCEKRALENEDEDKNEDGEAKMPRSGVDAGKDAAAEKAAAEKAAAEKAEVAAAVVVEEEEEEEEEQQQHLSSRGLACERSLFRFVHT